ncbi:hypothetical protein [Streptomyces dysideae]|uniref:Uncharacterized protein n=1 Tax=Streptomyces dysideae TaxID=909626 RepID=A0A101V0F7_9ACTN|nr:hypothetical protein [Streptomyces dysideae]KUO20250.1 hypothetical protein AQJ91_15865 [Streptomyces dysideae]
MRKVTKAAATLLLGVPLTIGLGQAAFAAEGPAYHEGTASATAAGATSSNVMSGFLENRDLPLHSGLAGPYYVSSDRSATAFGASSDVVTSGFDADGVAHYTATHLTVNSSGAASSITHSTS